MEYAIGSLKVPRGNGEKSHKLVSEKNVNWLALGGNNSGSDTQCSGTYCIRGQQV